MNTIKPEFYRQRSFIYRQFADAEFSEIANGALALSVGGDQQAGSAASRLIDLSLVPRAGFRGVNAEQHLITAGLPIPARPNHAELSENGEWVLRLSQKEFWVLSNPLQLGLEHLQMYALPENACYPLYCQDSHAWFVMTGEYCAEVMAKVCGVDLREQVFAAGEVAQTSVARVNAIIVKHTVGGETVFSILSDSASAEYFWHALLDAMNEYDGQVAGLNRLRK